MDLSELDKLIKVQNKEYYDLYDALAKNLKKKEQIEILNLNTQFVPDTKNEVNLANSFSFLSKFTFDLNYQENLFRLIQMTTF